mmetsp:Transcript_14992/g.22887  ORF Transcript_14992/g.22887 Transcript_14992/m.22887 type:complete len:549 (-) Transcript_14992:81-1727(-)
MGNQPSSSSHLLLDNDYEVPKYNSTDSSISTIDTEEDNSNDEMATTCFSPQRPLRFCSPSSFIQIDEAQQRGSLLSHDRNIISFPRYTKEEMALSDAPTEVSNLRPSTSGVRQFWIVTTAALPWMTGTAVNPLLRAGYLSQLNRPFSKGKATVTLVLPWLISSEHRVALYGSQWENATQKDQEIYIRQWLAQELPLEANEKNGGIKIVWYSAKYHARYGSIFAVVDICSLFGSEQLDVCFLEEPEHLNVYRAPGKRLWTDIFRHVVGVGHTNYVAYVQKESLVGSAVFHGLASWMVKAYCHKLIKLSPVLQNYDYDREVVCNVHGIRKQFFHNAPPEEGIYFLGKLVWAKGFQVLSQFNAAYKKQTGNYFSVDVIGSGPDEDEIQALFKQKKQPVSFLGKQDHAALEKNYKILVNPSLSEVLCTVTAEAVAMGKFCILPRHASNTFFEQFSNCLLYRNAREFCQLLDYALTHEPVIDEQCAELLTWTAATDRCLDAAAVSQKESARLERLGRHKSQQQWAQLHNSLNKGEKGKMFRAVLGAGPIANQA